ncbi:cytochrome c peroxidase [Rhizobium viscosum]|uniref:Cytochrome c peroxidase n=1 Tax=Rhizobium viscosum TaxID=1673 RepID=A0ABR9J0M0_RHIVS|nr:cytochrome c peroxidase [Rhizobium viscosum]MBE1508627.1 cytochrome c peroxidase [Rhizobium viscosum]
MRTTVERLTIGVIATCALILLAFAGYRSGAADDLTDVPGADINEPILPIAAITGLDGRKVELGAQLFSDKLLSSRRMFSCLSCHDLSMGGTVRSPRTTGYNGRMHRFNAPSIFNVGLNYRLGWRGNFTSLEAQNEAVLLDRNLMAITWPELISRLRAHTDYADAFRRAYQRSIRREDVLDALATYERSLVTPDAPFDRYLRGDGKALMQNAKNGFRLFKTLGCASCHQGMNVGGNVFQKFGIFQDTVSDRKTMDEGDLGRWTITHDEADIGVFRVPSLRNVALTAPYFHDGRVASLYDAVKLMGRMQLGQDVSDPDAADIVEFLKSLTGKFDGHALEPAD